VLFGRVRAEEPVGDNCVAWKQLLLAQALGLDGAQQTEESPRYQIGECSSKGGQICQCNVHDVGVESTSQGDSFLFLIKQDT